MANRINKLGAPTRYAKIYDHFYEKFAKQKNYKISNDYKAEIMNYITTYGGVTFDDIQVIEAIIRYKTPLNASKMLKGYTKAQISKKHEIAERHMYSPSNIAAAVNGYYNSFSKMAETPLTEKDFCDNKFVLSALARQGITTREALMKHLSNGWYYLWTIPGCGDRARQLILRAIDKWEGKSINE